MTSTVEVQIGSAFRVASIQAIKNAKGVLLAKYLPEFPYQVTPRNVQEVTAWVNSGKATIGQSQPTEAKPAAGVSVGAAKAVVKGAAKIGSVPSTKKSSAKVSK